MRGAHATIALAFFLAASGTQAQSATPGKPIALVNAGFESLEPPKGAEAVAGWFNYQHAGELSYDFALDSEHKRSGTQSLRIVKIGSEPYGTIAQEVPAVGVAGRKVRLSAWIRTAGIGEGRGQGAALVMLALRSGSVIAENSMRGARISGTSDWKRHSIELDVPAQVTRFEVGAMLRGEGRMWVDDFELEVLER